MPRRTSSWNSLAMGIVAVFVGLLAAVLTGSVFNLFFVAIVVAVLWNDSSKLNDLQKRLSTIEESLKGQQPRGLPADSRV